MHRPDHPSAVSGQFSDGDPGQGIDATVVQASWLNGSVLEELVAVVEAGGLTLDKLNENQLLEAIVGLIALQAGNKNLLINPKFDIWQLGVGETSVASSFVRTDADCWYMNPQGGQLQSSRQTFTSGQTAVPGHPTYYLQVAKTGTPSAQPSVMTFVEDLRPLGGQSVTVSFWAKAASALNLDLAQVTDYGSGSSSADQVDTQPFSITTAWAKYTHTFTVPSNDTKDINSYNHLRWEWRFPNDAVAATLQLANVQVEIGTGATTFQSPSTEMAWLKALRYVETSYGSGSEAFSATTNGAVLAYAEATRQRMTTAAAFKVPKLLVPTVTWYSTTTAVANKVWQASPAGDVDVTDNDYESVHGPGSPVIPGAADGMVFAHFLAEAHLPF